MQTLLPGFKNFTSGQRSIPLEKLLFPERMKNREGLRRSPYANFFIEIVREIEGKHPDQILEIFDNLANSKGNQFYDGLNLDFADWLKYWGQSRLSAGKRQPRIESILDGMQTLWNYPRGSQASNLEISLVCNQLQLITINRDNEPRLWASLQNNLGNIYRNRFSGSDRLHNIEQSIAYYQAALEIYTKDDFPLDWAMVHNNLASAYLLSGDSRPEGKVDQNSSPLSTSAAILQSISYYTAALDIYTKDDFPLRWATTQNNLGNAYSQYMQSNDLLIGSLDRADTIERAIQCYAAALQVYMKGNFPLQWATTISNLAAAYLHRIRNNDLLGRDENRSKFLEKAIQCYLMVLEIHTKALSPNDWAMTQHNLANAYLMRIRGISAPSDHTDQARTIQQAITCYLAALEIYTKTEFSLQWANTQNNLGNAYSEYLHSDGLCISNSDRANYITKSIACHTAALEVYNSTDHPIDWAITQNNLGSIYSDSDQAQNIEKSIECYENALPVLAHWGDLQQLKILKNNLLRAYGQRQTPAVPHNIIHITAALRQLTQTCLEQADWYKASLSLFLCFKIQASNGQPEAALYPLLQAIGLDLQHHPQLIETDLQELSKLSLHLSWQPADLPRRWQKASSIFPTAMPPLDPAIQAKICLALGVVNIQQQNWSPGLDWLKAGWEIQQQGSDRPGLAEISYQIAIAHHLAGNFSSAGVYYRDARLLFQHLGDLRKVAFCHHALGRLLLQVGSSGEAATELNQALVIYHQLPNNPPIQSRIINVNYLLGET